jgi:alanine dehydrogenase
MVVGVPREIKDHENRVAITPAVVEDLRRRGHTVLVESDAGLGSGIDDDEFAAAGAQITTSAKAWSADFVLKVKEPLPKEYAYLRREQILFTYLHLATAPQLVQQLLATGLTAIAYETVQLQSGELPLLTPMSEIAGRMAIQIGAQYLEKVHGGRGVLLGGIPGVPPAEVVIIGGGTVGANAARIALGMGAHVTLLDVNLNRLRYLADVLAGNLTTVMSNRQSVERSVRYADLLVGAVLIPGARTPRLVTEDLVRTMKPGSVIVDVAVDQGGCIETVDHPSTHSEPTYVKHGVLHYAVSNIPGAVPRTSTFALANATHNYVVELADRGLEALKRNPALAKGANIFRGAVVHQGVAAAHGLPCTPLQQLLV